MGRVHLDRDPARCASISKSEEGGDGPLEFRATRRVSRSCSRAIVACV